MANYCCDCTYLKIEGETNYEKFWCDAKYEWHAANELECYRFCRAYNRSSSVSKSAYDYSKEHTSSGCYLTTIVCDILKAPDDSYPLNAMRNFRNNILQKDDKYKNILVEYDIIGPQIVKNLNEDPNKLTIATNCFYNFIVPVIKLSKSKNFDEAINLYSLMTNNLKNLYNLNYINITEDMINNADIEKSGHGIYKEKLLQTK